MNWRIFTKQFYFLRGQSDQYKNHLCKYYFDPNKTLFFPSNHVVLIFRNDSDSDCDELSDGEISKLLIVTQTPVRPKKHEGFDRTGDFSSRVKMSQDLAQVINDGLVYYEEHLDFDEEEKSWIESKKNKNVNLVTQAEFDKLKPESGKKISNPAVPPPPPPLNTPANGAFLHSGKAN